MAPIAYFSKATSSAERNYHSFELETLAIVKAVERFHVYLQGIVFRVVTDCNSLVLAMRKININPKIARWTLFLQNYRFELIHRSSEKMTHVDCLSWSVFAINLHNLEDELMYRQLSDPKLKEIAEEVELKGSKLFSVVNGLLFRAYKERSLFVVPDAMINNIIRIYHDDLEHVGCDKTLHGILGHYWFPSLKMRVRQYIDNCVRCLTSSVRTGQPEGEMQLTEREAVPFHTLYLDHFGPLEGADDGSKYICMAVDAYTKFVWVYTPHCLHEIERDCFPGDAVQSVRFAKKTDQ